MTEKTAQELLDEADGLQRQNRLQRIAEGSARADRKFQTKTRRVGNYWNCEEMPTLEGKIVGFGSIPAERSINGKECPICLILDADGQLYQVASKTRLVDLFALEIDTWVRIEYFGQLEAKGEKAGMKDFEISVAE